MKKLEVTAEAGLNGKIIVSDGYKIREYPALIFTKEQGDRLLEKIEKLYPK